MKYKGYTPVIACLNFWSWLHFSWNYIGKSNYTTDIVRHIGLRWFGHSWDKEIIIPLGELRF